MNQIEPVPFIGLFALDDAAAAQRISARLSLVLSDPAAYQKQFAEELAERGFGTALPEQELRDIALIDALWSEELLLECDEDDTAASIAEGLNEILARQYPGKALRLPVVNGTSRSVPEQLDTVQDALEAQGLSLALFTLDSDAYPLGVVADAQAGEARRLAKELGFGVTVY